jgi:hypothetical protein
VIALRWLEWPTPRTRSDGAIVRVAHAFKVADGKLAQPVEALCGADLPIGQRFNDGSRVEVDLRIIHPGEPHARCYRCDEQLRTRNGPHPQAQTLRGGDLTFQQMCYSPRWTFEDWVSEG